jgi:predicted ribosomally synthesized peptide with SipW-like signal peptide
MGKLERIIGLSLAGLLIACLAIGGTWAYMTDTETSNNNQITAGTLEMKTSVNGSGGPYTNGVTQTLVCSNLKPGRTITATTIQLENVGSTSGGTVNISLSYNTDDSADTTPNTVNMSTDDLAKVLQITTLNYDSRSILSNLSDLPANGGNGNGYIDVQDMKNEASRLTGLGGLNPGQIRPFDITVQMVSSAGTNTFSTGTFADFVGDGINITVTFILNQ